MISLKPVRFNLKIGGGGEWQHLITHIISNGEYLFPEQNFLVKYDVFLTASVVSFIVFELENV